MIRAGATPVTDLKDELATFYDIPTPQRAARNPQPQHIQ
jgi:hypothetical protein